MPRNTDMSKGVEVYMNEYEFEHTHCYEGTYTLEEVALNNTLYEECIKEESLSSAARRGQGFCVSGIIAPLQEAARA